MPQRPSRPHADPREVLDERMMLLERRLDELLYDGRWENMTRVALEYVAKGEMALQRGDIGEAQYFLERAKSICGIRDSNDEE